MSNPSRNELTSVFQEIEGTLGVTEFGDIPFTPKRFFWLSEVGPGATRANHGHRNCHQLLICQQGTLNATVTRGNGEISVHYMSVGTTLHLPPLHWLELSNFSQDAVLGVLASEPYDKHEYITSREELSELWNSIYKV
jgi:UDP-2-acetamido-3-amino-2,3-dideoxy-glucuronate N-acetyltransferase